MEEKRRKVEMRIDFRLGHLSGHCGNRTATQIDGVTDPPWSVHSILPSLRSIMYKLLRVTVIDIHLAFDVAIYTGGLESQFMHIVLVNRCHRGTSIIPTAMLTP